MKRRKRKRLEIYKGSDGFYYVKYYVTENFYQIIYVAETLEEAEEFVRSMS